MNNNYYSTYRFYNEKKRRLSAFARENNNEIEITLWECDRHDSFTKEYARDMYENYLEAGNFCYYEKVRIKEPGKTRIGLIEKCAKPQMITIPKEDGQGIKQTFLNYMEENYLKAYPRYKLVGYSYLDKKEREQFEEEQMEELAELLSDLGLQEENN